MAGAAYFYKNLNGADKSATESVKLVASDGAPNNFFNWSVCLVGAYGHAIDGSQNSGSAYYYKDLANASGTVTETLRLHASDGGTNEYFGHSVSLDGGRFAIGACCNKVNGIRAGDIRAFTVLDAGNTTLVTDGLSFVSQRTWVVGGKTCGKEADALR